MSIKLMSQVWESHLPSSEKFVCLALADHGRDDGSRIYPSVNTICTKTGFSRRTVQRLLRSLEAMGILSVVKKSVRYGTTEYLIRGDNLTPLNPDRGVNDDVQGRHCDAGGASIETSRGVTVTPDSLENHPLNTTQVGCGEVKKLFETFWSIFPARSGQKNGREKAKILFQQLSPEDRKALIDAARNYSGSDAVLRGIGILDPANFISRKDRDTGVITEPWRTWAGLSTIASGPGPMPVNGFAQQNHDRKVAEEEREKIRCGELVAVERPRLFE